MDRTRQRVKHSIKKLARCSPVAAARFRNLVPPAKPQGQHPARQSEGTQQNV